MNYYISLPIIISLYVLGLILLRFFKNKTITNIIFCFFTVSLYISNVVIAYIKNGPYDWNFTNTLPTANVSPFMFILCPLAVILPKKARWVFQTLISLLSIGMFFAAILSIIYNGIRDYTFHLSLYFDYLAHLALSLWGSYFVISKQIDLSPKKAFISGSIIVIVAFIMLIINCIFKTSYFGLALDEKYNIYNAKIVNNAYLSAFIYFNGLVLTMVIGYFYQRLIHYLFCKENFIKP